MEKGFDYFINNFFLYINNKVGKGKIVINSEKPGIHYTIYLKGYSGEIDIHRTNERTDYHKTLFKMKESDAILIFNVFEKIIPTLIEKHLLSNKIDYKILIQKDWYIFPSDDKTIDPKLIFKFSSKSLRFNKDVRDYDFSKYYKPIKRINSIPSNTYTVYSGNHRLIGSLIKLNINQKKNIYILIRKSSITRFSQDCFTSLIKLIKENNIENKNKLISLLNKMSKEIRLN